MIGQASESGTVVGAAVDSNKQAGWQENDGQENGDVLASQPGNSGGALVDERGNVIGVVVAKLSQKAALAATGTLAENVNYAVKSSLLLGFLESLPEVASKLKEPNTRARKFEDVKDVERATVLVLVY